MLRALHIENAALIRRLDIDLTDGFNVFTGETGAGKSIIIGSLGLLIGGRADKDLIRTGEEKALVSGLFTVTDERIVNTLYEIGVEADENGELLLSRTISLDGRSVCRINGRAVSLSIFRSVGQTLVAIHGQHDTRSLLDPASHLPVLDKFAENQKEKFEYQSLFQKIQKAKAELSQLLREKAETKRLAELLRVEAKEIDKVAPKAGEIEELEQKRKFLQGAKQLKKQANTVVHALYKNEKGVSASDLVGYAINAVTAMGDAFPNGDKVLEKLMEFQLEMENISDTAADLASLTEDDPDTTLTMIDDRLSAIRILQKKYGSTVEEILAHSKKAKERLYRLEESEGREASLRQTLENLVVMAREKALVLHNTRVNAAQKLKTAVSDQLAYLDLGKVAFETPVELQYNDKNVLMLGADGADSFEFLISANVGEPPRPIAKIASGGELSRIMLALKTVLADSEETPTLIFDEIDTGISGKTSQKIGFLMKKICDSTQIICVTHSAQLASSAASHFKIAKAESDGRMETSITALDHDGRVEELARILGGVTVTETVRQNARELLNYHN